MSLGIRQHITRHERHYNRWDVRLAQTSLFIVAIGGAFYFGLLWQGRLAPGSVPIALAAQPELAPIAPRGPLHADELTTVELFRRSAPSVVFITTIDVRRQPWTVNEYAVPSGSGSGFIWDEQGHIVTNYHVIEGAEAAQVTLADQTTWTAQPIGFAAEKDLAVLRIDAPEEKLKPLPRGSSSDLLVGQKAFAIGNPFGLDHSLTTGVVSALGREIESRDRDRTRIEDVIQTDAAINPGNSGGPLLDSEGRLIGVNTQIYSPSGASAGIGFAIPADTVNWVVPDLIEYGRIMRPKLGIYPVSDALARRNGIKGLIFDRIDPDGGAAEAGLRPIRRDRQGRWRLGDVITAIDGQSVLSRGDLTLILEKREIGDLVTVKYLRNGQEKEVRLRLQ